MSKEKLFQVGVKALITNKSGQILLLYVGEKHWNTNKNHWDIPGGRIQESHSILETLSREVEEETGITKITDPKFFTAVISKHEFTEGKRKIGLVLMVYTVQVPENSTVKLSSEHESFEWVAKKEAAKRLANKYPSEFTSLL